MKILGLALLVIFASSCEVSVSDLSSDNREKSDQFKDGPLEGRIDSHQWVFESGRVKPSAFGDERFGLEFWDTTEDDPCNAFNPGGDRKIFGAFPLELGTVSFSMAKTMTILVQSEDGYQNLIVTSGRLKIEEITEDKVTGKLYAHFDRDNEINGAFELMLCD